MSSCVQQFLPGDVFGVQLGDNLVHERLHLLAPRPQLARRVATRGLEALADGARGEAVAQLVARRRLREQQSQRLL